MPPRSLITSSSTCSSSRRLACSSLPSAGGGIDAGLDRLVDLAHLGVHRLAGLGRQAGELAHLVGDHREAAAELAGAGSLDGDIERQQVGLAGNFLHALGHLLELAGVAAQMIDGGQKFMLALAAGSEAFGDPAQALVGLAQVLAHAAIGQHVVGVVEAVFQALVDGAEAFRATG